MRAVTHKQLKVIATLLCLAVLLSACIASDCGWGSSAKAWIDENENGLWDVGEVPLSDVQFRVDNTQGQHMNAGSGGKSNSKGEARLFVGLIGCGPIDYTIYPVVPTGYRLTTQSSLNARGMPGNTYGPYLFGFTYLPGMPTATPRPPAPVCTSYEVGNNKVSDLLVTATDEVWITTDGGGVAKIDSRNGEWMTYTTRDGLANNRVRAVAANPDGTVWFGTDGGAAYNDGKTWKTYTSKDGLVSDNIYDVAVDSKGMVWFATEHGISRFDPPKNEWTSYTSAQGLPAEFVNRVVPAADGSIWFATLLEGVVRLMPDNQQSQHPKWLTYSRYTDPKNPLSLVDDIKVAPDGTVWFARPGISTFDPTKETWTQYDYQNTDGALPDGATSIAFAPDGTAWIGTRAGAIHYVRTDSSSPFDKWLLFNTQDGLASDSITSVAVESNGNVWFGTDKGVTRCMFPGK